MKSSFPCRRLDQPEIALIIIQHAFLFQLAHFGGKTAAVNLQIVCKSLPVKGDGEVGASGFLGLHEQVGHQLVARGALSGDERAAVHGEVLVRYELEEVEDDPVVEGTGA